MTLTALVYYHRPISGCQSDGLDQPQRETYRASHCPRNSQGKSQKNLRVLLQPEEVGGPGLNPKSPQGAESLRAGEGWASGNVPRGHASGHWGSPAPSPSSIPSSVKHLPLPRGTHCEENV